MSLIKSISGIRGTIGGKAGEGLSPLDIVKFTAAYATFIRNTTTKTSNTIVVGRDARLSGDMVCRIVTGRNNSLPDSISSITEISIPLFLARPVEDMPNFSRLEFINVDRVSIIYLFNKYILYSEGINFPIVSSVNGAASCSSVKSTPLNLYSDTI